MQNKSLININNLDINHNLPVDEKVRIYINKVKNPYEFLVDDTTVRVSFRGKEQLKQETIGSIITKAH